MRSARNHKLFGRPEQDRAAVMRFWQAAEACRSSPGVYLVYLWKIDAGAPGTRKDACRGMRAAAAIAAEPVVRCGALAGARAISR
jgi:hypothetical protein